MDYTDKPRLFEVGYKNEHSATIIAEGNPKIAREKALIQYKEKYTSDWNFYMPEDDIQLWVKEIDIPDGYFLGS